MRDIKPTAHKRKAPHHQAPDELPPEAQELYEQHAAKSSSRRFTGSKVPVTNVHVPRQSIAHIAEERPLFAKVDITKKSHSLKKKKRISMRIGRKERTLVLSLLGVVIVTACMAAYIFLPKASIALVVKTAPLLIDQKFTIATNPGNIPNAVPGNIFTQNLNIEGSSPVTSVETVGTKATGKVQLINKTFDEQKIKERSRLITKDNVLFYMTSSATIPAADSAGVASVTVDVEAAEAGPAGNIAAQTLQFAALDKAAQSLVYGQNTAAFTNGSGEQIKIVTEADIEQAKNAAIAKAKEQSSSSVQSQLQNNWSILEESWDTELDTFTPNAKVGDKVDTISYTANGTVRVMTFQEDVLMKALEQALTAALSKDYMLFPGAISYTKSVDNANYEAGQVNITARVTHTTIPSFSLDTLKDKLAGRSTSEAINYLQGLPGIQNATIDTWPFWVKKVPEIQKRIDMKITSDRQP